MSSRGEARGNGSRADALSQTRQVILLGIEHGLWRGLPGLLRNAERCSDDGVMIDGWMASSRVGGSIVSEVVVVVFGGGLIVVSISPAAWVSSSRFDDDQRHCTAHFSPNQTDRPHASCNSIPTWM